MSGRSETVDAWLNEIGVERTRGKGMQRSQPAQQSQPDRDQPPASAEPEGAHWVVESIQKLY